DRDREGQSADRARRERHPGLGQGCRALARGQARRGLQIVSSAQPRVREGANRKRSGIFRSEREAGRGLSEGRGEVPEGQSLNGDRILGSKQSTAKVVFCELIQVAMRPMTWIDLEKIAASLGTCGGRSCPRWQSDREGRAAAFFAARAH